MQLIPGLWYSPFPMAPTPPTIEGDTMKSAVMFRDQVNAVVNWFEQWNECEQTVALYSLFQKLQPVQARFLSLVLEQTYSSWLDLKVHEQEANDPEFISNFCNESKENAVKNMLFHLPLLHPGNEEAKYQYLSLIPKILAHSIENSVHIEESRQLLSYSLLHPAISDEDRRSLSQWLRHLEDSIHNCSSIYFNPINGRANGNNEKMPLVNGNVFLSENGYNSNHQNGWCGNVTGTSSLLDFGKEGAGLISMNNNCSSISGLGSNSLPTGLGITHMPLQAPNNQAHGVVIPPFHSAVSHTLPLYQSRLMRSNSLTPPISDNHQLSMQPSHGYSLEMVDANVNWLCNNSGGDPSPFHTNNLKSQSTIPGGSGVYGSGQQDHAPLSPQSSIASSGSGSESHPEEKNSFNTEGSGMKDVPSWLKTLRLHKYAHLFSQMTYEEMMNLSEDQLESHNVTKGARHKIVLSISKLRERAKVLRSLEKDLIDGGSLKNSLAELKAIIQTPMKAYGEISNEARDRHTSGANSPPGSPLNCLDNLSDGSNGNLPEDDLPGLFTRVMGKICSNLLVQARPEEECLNPFLMLIDKCLSHEAFNPTQKRRLFSWKQQVQKVWHPLPPRRSLDSRQNKGKWNSQSLSNSGPSSSPNVDFSSSHLQKGLNAAGSATNNPPPTSSSSGSLSLHHQNGGGNISGFHKSPGIPSQTSSHSGVGLGNTLQQQQSQQSSQEYLSRLQQTGTTRQRSPLSMVVKRPSLQDHLKPHVNIQRTHSAPVRFNALANSLLGKPMEDMSGDPEINTRLESLCLSMTEHALESLDENPDSLSSPGSKSSK